ncbi:MAG: hypothetical protein EXR99_15145 [Gemmataceae bacterium]|nr:hypothetical protein [Gemmataceae bacterium]
MNSPQALFLWKSLLKETLAQALSSRLLFLVAGYSCLILLLAGSVQLHNLPSDDKQSGQPWERALPSEKDRIGEEKMKEEGSLAIKGEIRLLFGAVKIPWIHFREKAIRFLQGLVGFFTADWPGLLIALLWTGSFMPEFRAGGIWKMALVRPVSPGLVVLFKAASVIAVLFLQGAFLLFLCWFLLGIVSQVWSGLFLWLIPMLLLQFLTFYPVSVFLGVWTRSGMVAVGGTVAFWAICWAVNISRIATLNLGAENPASAGLTTLSNLAYWILPKPVDYSLILGSLLGALKDCPYPHAWLQAWDKGDILPVASIFTSLLFSLGVLALAWFETNQEKDPGK